MYILDIKEGADGKSDAKETGARRRNVVRIAPKMNEWDLLINTAS